MNYRKIYDSLIDDARCNPPDGYVELHHVLPRSLGGGNGRENIVALTPKQHFIAHLLLAKIYGGNMWAALAFMVRGGTKSANGARISSRAYSIIKARDAKWRSEKYSGDGNPFFNKTHTHCSLLKMRRPRENKEKLYGRKVDGIGDVISFVLTYKPRHKEPDLSLMNRINECVSSSNAETKRMVSFYRRSESVSKAISGRDYKGKNNPNYGNGSAISGTKNPMFGMKHKDSTKALIGQKAKRKLRCPHCGKEANIANAHRWHFDNCKHKNT